MNVVTGRESRMKLCGRMNRAAVLFILTALGLCSGCQIIGILFTPTPFEKKIPAEYEFSRKAEDGVLVLVQQPAWLNVQTDLRPGLTDAVNILLRKKAKVNKKAIIDYDRLVEFRRSHSDFSSLTPRQVGDALGVKTVLVIIIENYVLSDLPIDGYYEGLQKGELDVRSYLLDVAGGEVLWPTDSESKLVRLQLEAERGGKEACAARLSRAAAHCIVRYFYDCRKDKFRTWGERPDTRKGDEW